MRKIRRFFWSCVFLVTLGVAFAYWFAARQGGASVDWSAYSTAKVAFDSHSVPIIQGSSWQETITAQGFVTAADRLWQMDLMRRSGAGRLAEWFGNNDRVVAFDEKRRREDWQGVARTAVADLPDEERAACEAFATGVNQFISQHSWQWGVEYALLQSRPEPWQCEDTLLILLSMVEDLTEAYEEEAQASVWRKFLPSDWERFLFTSDHPWNQPIFEKGKSSPKFNFPKLAIPASPLTPSDSAEVSDLRDFVHGSNAWVYRSAKGLFLASDPHLSYGVPQLWYPIKLKVSEQEWVVGVSIPGIPGVVIGRNAKIAWGFTNAKEDVDDLLEETLSPDGKKYLASKSPKGREEWKLIEERPYEIRIRGASSRRGVAQFTHRGPLSERKFLGKLPYSRQWLGFTRGALRLPAIYKATDWSSFNEQADAFAAPAQAIVYANVDGSMGVRVSGRGIKRRKTGLIPQRAVEGEWLGLESPASRPRIFVPPGRDKAFVSTANQRLWTSGWGEHWSTDVRQERIRSVLGQSRDLSRDDMRNLQLDTHSRFLKVFLAWISTQASGQSEKQKEILKGWSGWNGFAKGNERVFAQAILGRKLFTNLLLGRVRAHYLPEAAKEVAYRWKMEGAWQLRLWESSDTDPLLLFGLKSSDVANWILHEIETANPQGYSHENRWRSQHPFAKAIPWLGVFFELGERPQVGFGGVVRVERPTEGASMRAVFDLQGSDPGEWSFPVGQSGHIASPHYRNFRKAWFEETYLPCP